MTLTYDPPHSYTADNRVQPGTAALRQWWMFLHPEAHEHTDHAHSGVRPDDLGILRDPERTPLSEHHEGRSWDAGLLADVPAERDLGDHIFAWSIANAEAIGLQSAIWRRRVWGFGNWTIRDYTGPHPHNDHVHLGLNWWGAANLTTDLLTSILEDDMAFTDEDRRMLRAVHSMLSADLPVEEHPHPRSAWTRVDRRVKAIEPVVRAIAKKLGV